MKGGKYSREETIRGNMVSVCVSLRFSRLILLEIYIYLRETSSSSNLHSCIQSQDCRPLQNIVKYYTKCMNPMKRMEQSRNVEKALDCDKNTYRPSFQGFRKFIWMILSKYELGSNAYQFFTLRPRGHQEVAKNL